MSEIQIASRYAKSLLDLAEEKGMLDEVYQDMVLFLRTCEASRPLRLLLANPIVNNYKKLQSLREIFSGKITALTIAFLELIVRKTREGLLYGIAQQFEEQYNQMKNLEVAEVTTAIELSDDLRGRMTVMATKISGGKKITLKEHIKPEIIGGFILKVRDNQIDSSIASRLGSLKVQLIK